MSIDKNKSWKRRGTEKTVQMFIADILGNAADLVFLRFQNQIDNAVPFVKKGFKQIAYYPIKILQKPIELVAGQLTSIEGEEAKEARLSQDPEKRLDGLLDAAYHYGAAMGVGFATLAATEKVLSNKMHTTHVPNKMWWMVDAPVHILASLVIGSRTMQPATGAAKNMLKKVMVASGWSEEKAEQDSRFTIGYILPNYLTLLPTAGMMAHLYHAEEKGIVEGFRSKGWFGGDRHHFRATGKTAAPGELGLRTEAAVKIAKAVGIIEPHEASLALGA